MWTCPDCGRSFANTNQWHSCLELTLEEHLLAKTPESRALFEAVVGALSECGEFRIHPQKTRVGFISTVAFGGVRLARKWVDLSLILPRPLDDARVRKLELYGPTSWVHTFRLYTLDDLDESMKGWLCEALERGDRKNLDPAAEVQPIRGRMLDVFWTGLRVVVQEEGDGLVVELPGYVASALALVDSVDLKLGGIEYSDDLLRLGGGTLVPVDPTTGLGIGDEADLFITVS